MFVCFLSKKKHFFSPPWGGPFGGFQHLFCRKTKKNEEGTLWEIFFPKKKSRNAEKLKGGTLWSRPVSYVTPETFWFSSLGQQRQFKIL